VPLRYRNTLAVPLDAEYVTATWVHPSDTSTAMLVKMAEEIQADQG